MITDRTIRTPARRASERVISQGHSLAGASGWGGIVLLVMLFGCRKPAPTPVPQGAGTATSSAIVSFDDVSDRLSAPSIYRNGEESGLLGIIESLGGGAGVVDYDRDGQPDLCFPGGGTLSPTEVGGLPTRLYRGVGTAFLDISERARIDVPTHYSHGCAVADYDNDGFADLLITGYGGVTLWHNMGDGTFINATATQPMDDSWSSSAGWGDVDGDGLLDLFLAHYVDWSLENNPPCDGPAGIGDVCPPRQFEGLDDTLLHNAGDGTFADWSERSGLLKGGKGLGVLLADVDHDADIDVYVANDTTNNFLYRNDGAGRFDEIGILSGTAVDHQANANGSMGLALSDFDRDGQSDIWVTNYEDEMFGLYQNMGDANFMHVSGEQGINLLGNLFVGFGCVTGDFDLDGDEDLVVANGHVVHYPRNAPKLQQPLLLVNQNGKQFAQLDEPAGSYFAAAHTGRGLATLDFNHDGRLDLLFVNTQEPAALMQNDTPANGQSLRIDCIGTIANRTAIGTRVVVTTTKGVILTRQVTGGGSYLSSSESSLHFGIAKGDTVESIRVHWPSGTSEVPLGETLTGTDPNTLIAIEPTTSNVARD